MPDPFRMVVGDPAAGTGDDGFSLQVIAHRQSFPDAVTSTAAIGWFLFVFHQPVIARCGDGERLLPADSLLVVAEGEPLAHRPASSAGLLRSWVRCRGDRVAAAMRAAGLRSQSPVQGTGEEVLAGLFALHHACTHPRPPTADHLFALLQAWLCAVARDALPLASAPRGSDIVRRYLETHWAEPQRLDDLAALAGCSRAQLCRRFRAAVGCSPIQYLLRLRLEHARELLHTTRLDLCTIAERCGFSDRYHLSKSYALRYGLGPAGCRRRALSGQVPGPSTALPDADGLRAPLPPGPG